MTKEVTIGCDPEFFLFDTDLNEYVSAHGMVPGTKAEPMPLKNGAVQVDGTALEFNINPARTAKEFENNVLSVLQQIRRIVPSKFQFSFKPAINYSKKVWDNIPPEAKELGCSPDYLSNGATNPPPKPHGTMRTGGGHIHVGWTEGADIEDPSHLLDCILINKRCYYNYANNHHTWDTDYQRARMYGGHVPFRPKSYGVEHRWLSNAWVRYPGLYRYIFEQAYNAYMSAVAYGTSEHSKYYSGFPKTIGEEIEL